jgi:hypothetical protein
MRVDHPRGEATMLLPPFNISGVTAPSSRIPALGEHDTGLVEHLRRRARP